MPRRTAKTRAPPADTAQLMRIVEELAAANHRLLNRENELKRRQFFQEQYNQSVTELISAADLEKTLGRVLAILCEAADAEIGIVFLHSPEDKKLVPFASHNLDGPLLSFELGAGLVGSVAREKKRADLRGHPGQFPLQDPQDPRPGSPAQGHPGPAPAAQRTVAGRAAAGRHGQLPRREPRPSRAGVGADRPRHRQRHDPPAGGGPGARTEVQVGGAEETLRGPGESPPGPVGLPGRGLPRAENPAARHSRLRPGTAAQEPRAPLPNRRSTSSTSSRTASTC